MIGISPDSPAKQLKFDEKYKLGFPLLADEDHTVAEKWGVWGEKSMYGRKYLGIIRSAFVIDEKGKIADAFYKVSPKATFGEHRARSRRSASRPRRTGCRSVGLGGFHPRKQQSRSRALAYFGWETQLKRYSDPMMGFEYDKGDKCYGKHSSPRRSARLRSSV